MNPINFLPDSFTAERVRHRRVGRQAVLILVVLLAMAGWHAGSRGRLAALQRQTEAQEREARAIAAMTGQIQTLQDQRRTLHQQVLLQRELSPALSQAQIIATLGRLLPDRVTATELMLTARRPEPTPPSTANAKSADGVPRAKPQARGADVVHLVLAGIAPSDVDIANAVGNLAGHPLFSNVKLLHSRAVEVSALQAREFRLEMEVNLEREFRPLASEPPEVAHAH